jgi:hypothetical protein
MGKAIIRFFGHSIIGLAGSMGCLILEFVAFGIVVAILGLHIRLATFDTWYGPIIWGHRVKIRIGTICDHISGCVVDEANKLIIRICRGVQTLVVGLICAPGS